MHAGTLAAVVIMVLAIGTENEAGGLRGNKIVEGGAVAQIVTPDGERPAERASQPQPPVDPAIPPHVPQAAPLSGPINLRDALALALARSPELGVFPYELRAAEARVLQAGLRPNPELQIGIEEFGGRGERRGFEAAETTVQVGLPIELAGKRAKRGRVASLDKELVQWDYETARLDVMREVAQAFGTLLAAQERLALTERLLDFSRQAQAAVAQRVKAGKDSPVDELQADVALSETRIDRQKAHRALTAARHRLAATWGDRTPLFQEAQGDFYGIAAPIPMTELAALVGDTPDLKRWRTEQERRQAALRLARAQGVPDITVGGGVRRFEQTDDAALVVGLSVPLPLFDRNQGGILEATADLAKTQRQYEAAQVRTLAALSEAASALAAAYDEVAILQNEVLPKAQRVFEAARQGYVQGKFDYLYLLGAQQTLFQTQAQYIDSLEAYHRARADVQRLIGAPPEGNELGRTPS